MRKQANAKTVAQEWLSHNANKAIAPEDLEDAKAWVKINVNLDNKALTKTLKKVYGSGWVFGSRDAKNKITAQVGFDWTTWEAGREAAAVLVDAPRGLSTILNRTGKTIKGIDDTTLDRMGSALANGLAQGLGAEEISRAIDYIIDDPARSMVIARTETARALVEASAIEYREAGITEVQWIVGEPCDICAENANMIMPLGEEFPSGDIQPPAHPNCVCDISPVVAFSPDNQEASEDIELADNPDLIKYDEDQPRDEQGRFASTAGETSGGEAGRVLARDALEREVKLIIEDSSESGYAHDRADMIKDYVSNSLGLALSGKVPEPELAVNPYTGISHPDWDENGIDNEELALVWNEATQDLVVLPSDETMEFETEGYIVANEPEGKEGLLAYATASGMLGAWAHSSNDNNANTLAIQNIAESHFGLTDAAQWGADNAGNTEQNFSEIMGRVTSLENTHEDLITTALDAQYNATQQFFQDAGISEITLYRGVEMELPEGTQEVTMRPLSSWSLESGTADAFGSTILQATFPVDRILSIPTTGIGCLGESEVVVLGGRINAEVSTNDVLGYDPEEWTSD